MSKAINIIDEFGDIYLGCSKCKEPIYFPLFKNTKPKCYIKCGQKLDWNQEVINND